MITRDNNASISGIAQSARQRLGEVIKFHRENRQLTTRDVSRRAKCPIADVEAWEAGRAVPNAEQWKALCHGINRSLHTYQDLRLRAIAERDAEQKTITRSIEVHATNGSARNNPATKITTNMGDKLRDVSLSSSASSARPAADSPTAQRIEPRPVISPSQVPQILRYGTPEPAAIEPKPEPDNPASARAQLGAPDRGTAKDGRKLAPVRPVGASSSDAVNRRREFVRELLAKRPDARTSGSDSVIEAVRKTFGIGISPEFVEEIREQLKRDKLKAEILAELPAVAQMARVIPQTTIDVMNAEQAQRDLDAKLEVQAKERRAAIANTPGPATGEINAGDLEAAVQLVLGAVPNLRTFSIVVDDNGEASIDYAVREVVVRENTGTFKVRRG